MTAPTTGSREKALEAYLHEHIPISGAMGITVCDASPGGVRLRAPLDLNINHRQTVFGGSAAAVAILAGWCMLHVRLPHDGGNNRIVIQRTSVEYIDPITSDFDAVALQPEPREWQKFERLMERRGRGRIGIEVELVADGRVVGRCSGAYVVLPPSADC